MRTLHASLVSRHMQGSRSNLRDYMMLSTSDLDSHGFPECEKSAVLSSVKTRCQKHLLEAKGKEASKLWLEKPEDQLGPASQRSQEVKPESQEAKKPGSREAKQQNVRKLHAGTRVQSKIRTHSTRELDFMANCEDVPREGLISRQHGRMLHERARF